MADSDSQNGIKGKVEFEVLWALAGVYSLLMTVSLVFFIRTVVVPNCSAIFRQRFYHGSMVLTSGGKN
jgi:hypothetical protein